MFKHASVTYTCRQKMAQYKGSACFKLSPFKPSNPEDF